MSVGAGLNLAIDFTLTVGALAESVKVTADNPLLEASGATQAVNVSNEMQRSLPLAGHRHWSEFLRLVPGAVSRDSTVNQAATFYIHGAGIVSFSTLVDGADITSAVNPWQAYSALPDETAADVQIKTNGFDAATPLGMAAASNLVLKSGTNALRGSGTFGYTNKEWIGRNTHGHARIHVADAAGSVDRRTGPPRSSLFFFGAYRYRSGKIGIGRPARSGRRACRRSRPGSSRSTTRSPRTSASSS